MIDIERDSTLKYFRGTRLCVVGSVCRDVKTAPIEQPGNLLADGETPTAALFETLGGGGADSALFAAALGADARFAGKIGDDALGARVEQVMRQQGVHTFLRRDPNVATGSSVVLTYANGQRHFISHQPNNYALAIDDIDLAALDGAAHLLRADVWFAEPMLSGGNKRLLQAARDRGIATSLDINWDPHWNTADETKVNSRKRAVRDLLPLVDLVHGNENELNRFADSTDLHATLLKLIDWGAGAVVVHRGKRGAAYFAHQEFTARPAALALKQVNAAGCGDLLSVCMMLLHGSEDLILSERLDLANQIVAEYISGDRVILPRM